MKTKQLIKVGALSTLLVFSTSLTSLAQSFPDIEGHWAKKEILWAADQHYVQGDEKGYFNPQNQLTRADFYRMVNQFAGLKDKAPVDFTDVKKDKWYYDEVAKGLVQGYIKNTKGRLYPEAKISREEAARILAEVYGLQADSSGLASYPDRESIVFKGQVGALTKAKIFTGLPSGNFGPKEGLSRAEAATLIYRAYQNLSLPQIYRDKVQAPVKEVSTPAKPSTPKKDALKVEATDYNLFKDEMLTKGYSLKEVESMWKAKSSKTDPRPINWGSYDEFYKYFKQLNYTDKEILTLWQDPDYRFNYKAYPLYWTRSYQDFYDHYRSLGYSRAWIEDQWAKGIWPSSPWGTWDYASFYKYYKDRGYSDSYIRELYTRGYHWSYPGQAYKFSSFSEFYDYFRPYYSSKEIDKMYNDGKYYLLPSGRTDGPKYTVVHY